ncbi:MAG: hypothetical protein ACKOEC_13030 [Acidimicrobiia bacterium]
MIGLLVIGIIQIAMPEFTFQGGNHWWGAEMSVSTANTFYVEKRKKARRKRALGLELNRLREAIIFSGLFGRRNPLPNVLRIIVVARRSNALVRL